jgi:phage tail sheath protein FI
MIEVSAMRGLAWTVFEPNGPLLWARVREMLEGFLRELWRAGALMGTKPEAAFFVRCDASTMSVPDIDEGRLVVEIGFAPVRQGEFQLLRLVMRTA